ncbi:MAG: DUF948 domain-containing protein [Varibaculum sp.]|nr:DUF948 domain-containing protein [Varibaculum sp.]
MTPSDIAQLIAAIAFALLVLGLIYPLIKLGRVFGELQVSVKEVTVNANETVKEATKVVRDANVQVTRVDAVTTSAAQVAQDVSALSTLVTATFGAPLIKVAAFSAAVRTFIAGKAGKRTVE